jgi:hypothetical protein
MMTPDEVEVIAHCKPEVKALLSDESKWRRCSPTVPPCIVCKKPVVPTPFRIFKYAGTQRCIEASLHIKCAFSQEVINEYDILNQDEDKESYSKSSCLSCRDVDNCSYVDERTKTISKEKRQIKQIFEFSSKLFEIQGRLIRETREGRICPKNKGDVVPLVNCLGCDHGHMASCHYPEKHSEKTCGHAPSIEPNDDESNDDFLRPFG